jgi:hypothetical protein
MNKVAMPMHTACAEQRFPARFAVATGLGFAFLCQLRAADEYSHQLLPVRQSPQFRRYSLSPSILAQQLCHSAVT